MTIETSGTIVKIPKLTLHITTTDVTASRAIDGTVYQNLTGKPLYVSVIIDGLGDGDWLLIGDTLPLIILTPPTITIAFNNMGVSGIFTIQGIVPLGWYYCIQPEGAIDNLVSWVEQEIDC